MISFTNFTTNFVPYYSDDGSFCISGDVDLVIDEQTPVTMLWVASLFTDCEESIDSVYIDLAQLQESNESSIELVELLNENGEAVKFKSWLLNAAFSDDYFLFLRDDVSGFNHSKSTPFQTDGKNHLKKSILVSSKYRNDNGVVLATLWNVSKDKDGDVVTHISPKSRFISEMGGTVHKGFLDCLRGFLPSPQLPQVRGFLPVAIKYSDTECVLAQGHDIPVSSLLTYTNKGAEVTVELTLKIYGVRLMIMIKGAHDQGRVWEFSIVGGRLYESDHRIMVPYHQLRKVVGDDSLTYKFLLSKAQTAINDNHKTSSNGSIKHTVESLLQSNEDFSQRFVVVTSNHDINGLTRSYRVFHEVKNDLAYIRAYWDININLEDGILAVYAADFSLVNIKLSGIKFTFFKGTPELDGLLIALEDIFTLDFSKRAVWDYAIDKFVGLGPVYEALGWVDGSFDAHQK